MSVLTTAPITNVGLTRLASFLLADVAYASLGTGTGLLGTALAAGTSTTTLTLAAPGVLPAGGLYAGQALTLVNGVQTQAVIVAGATPAGATSIPVQPFTPSVAFAVGSGLVSTPSASDIALQSEVYRKPITNAVAGATPGEVLATAYWAPTDAPGQTYLEIGFYGADASAAANSGTLLSRAVYWFPHTSSDSDTAQLDTII